MGQRTNGEAPERVVVIGLGRFGASAARILHELGYVVTVNEVADMVGAEEVGVYKLAAR